MATIFINYRRSDSRGTTFALREKLLKHFSENELFLDIEGLGGGEDFVNALANTVSLADVMVVIIGPHWLDARDAAGNLRLHQDDDFVRIEIASALAQDKKVLPVLLEGAQMPTAEDLPDDLKDLARRNAMDLRLNRIDDDARAIAEALKKLVPKKAASKKQMAVAAAMAGSIALVCGTLAGPFVNTWSGLDWGPDSSKIELAKVETRLKNALQDLGTARTDIEALEADLQEARAETRRATDEKRTAEAATNTALTKAQDDVKRARTETEDLRTKFTEQRDTLDDLRTDLKEAQVERRQFLDNYRESRGDILDRNREIRELEGQVKDHKLQIGYLENRAQNLCENYAAFIEDDEDGVDRSFLGNLLRVHCRRSRPAE